ncbi:monosaccharide ABC transporter ATP-binding protein, CUT2 family [Austwickia chelonae]|uniref:Putative ABC transporter ATP-binding protein n=1 Tax=Austwickia chelonae NBRC 105200 TaxID=1184607 RepID=K6VN93_9MICO|nr:sugar ABC transporter ATP-binding protein [Austwickia chelonae]GAB76850.1 putative ABC transporter ATP-binding protein [Austwickia chelonae NBRC 105200]SEW31542.1 monosaccharide ABC transporter ATP-binding protein, CUT2 family [Austwickia chelonae]
MSTEATTPAPIVRAVNVSKRFGGVVALRGVSVDFHPGEVHCLAGENGCGKSTLIKVISGVHRPVTGHVEIDGQEYARLGTAQAHSLGIEVIYQDFSLLPNLSAAENIALPGFVAERRMFMRPKKSRLIAEAALDQIGVDLPLDVPVEQLTVAERQLCAVARAMAHDARFIAMDEPTTALTWKEVDALFDAVHLLKERGVSMVFVSHKMQEVFSIADRVTVMRSGRVVTSGLPEDFSHASLTERMTGRSSDEMPAPPPPQQGDKPALSVRGMTHEPLYADVNLTVGRGEIVGVAGLLGSGRTEIVEGISGIRPAPRGIIEVAGRRIRPRSLNDAIDAGIAYVPEDRLTQGLFLDQSVGDNLIATRVGRRGGQSHSRNALRAAQEQAVDSLKITTDSLTGPVRALSGGNAQRVLLAKWLMGEPQVLILNGPTVGVDVGSKFDIVEALHEQSRRGVGILLLSDDIPELVTTCHRVLVVRSGRIVAELTGDELTDDALVEEISA